jgi:hypothetical protein
MIYVAILGAAIIAFCIACAAGVFGPIHKGGHNDLGPWLRGERRRPDPPAWIKPK